MLNTNCKNIELGYRTEFFHRKMQHADNKKWKKRANVRYTRTKFGKQLRAWRLCKSKSTQEY